VLQLIMVTVVVLNPGLVSGSLCKAAVVDDATVTDMLNNMPGLEEEAPAEGAEESDPTEGMEGADAQPAEPAAGEEPAAEDDPAKALEEAIKKAE
jgi:hypothetical protein